MDADDEGHPARLSDFCAYSGIGLTAGIGMALVAMRLLRSVLAGLESGPAAHTWVAGTLVTGSTGMACWIPARRATRTDPISALREE